MQVAFGLFGLLVGHLGLILMTVLSESVDRTIRGIGIILGMAMVIAAYIFIGPLTSSLVYQLTNVSGILDLLAINTFVWLVAVPGLHLVLRLIARSIKYLLAQNRSREG